ncbi:hypothetical protein [Streptomyces sp. NPDC002889]|uniref:hypothetical protein n=1 Tax=Streptomyces sp. NPDC002889 TaxID=3364669 RepID=UPI00367437AD
MPDLLITPERAKEIKRAAARHAAGMILVSLVEWAPREYAPNDARSDAEEGLLREEIERIAYEIKARSVVGTAQPCAKCGFRYRVKANGRVGRHHGVDQAGFSTGEPCPGVGLTPAP